MQEQDQDEHEVEAEEQVEQNEETLIQPAVLDTIPRGKKQAREIDWLAVGIVVLLSGLFAIAGRLNTQPMTSLTPVAVLSATGCGLLVTALRKLHSFERPGLLEAALGGLFLALFQFVIALSYSNVVNGLSQAADERLGFLSTWGLIGTFTIIFSMVGALLGHMAFRPTDVITKKKSVALNTTMAIVLLGLAPTMVGYVFAAAYDYLLQVNLFFPGPYPTIRLLSTLLPWQLPISFNVNSSDPNAVIFLLWQLWRIPLFLGNPRMFDIQSLEPFLFNGAAAGLLLWNVLTMKEGLLRRPALFQWAVVLSLELLLGLCMVLPADLLIIRGLQGLLQDQFLAIPIRTLHILDQPTFLLNLITGPAVCVVIGGLLLFLRRRNFPPIG